MAVLSKTGVRSFRAAALLRGEPGIHNHCGTDTERSGLWIPGSRASFESLRSPRLGMTPHMIRISKSMNYTHHYPSSAIRVAGRCPQSSPQTGEGTALGTIICRERVTRNRDL